MKRVIEKKDCHNSNDNPYVRMAESQSPRREECQALGWRSQTEKNKIFK